MRDQEILDAIHAAVATLEMQIAPAIAEGIRVSGRSPGIIAPTVAQNSSGISLQFGTVVGAFLAQGYATVLLDGQQTPAAVTVLGATNVGDRVGVLFYPPSGALMLGTVAPTSGGGGGSSSALDWFNVKTYGAVGNGSTDDSNPVQAAAAACLANGGGVLYFPAGIYPCQFVCAAAMQVVGEGPDISVLILPDNALGISGTIDDEGGVPLFLENNVTVLELEATAGPSGPPFTQEDGINSILLENGLNLNLESGASSGPAASGPRVIETAGFGSFTGMNVEGGPARFAIRGLTVDGNRAFNPTSSGIVIYGSDYRLDNLRVRNCANNGIYSEWSTSAGRPDAAVFTEVKVHDCLGVGIQTVGGLYAKYGVYTYLNGDADSGP